MAKRDLFAELKQGVREIKLHRRGKITLRQYVVKPTAKPNITAEEIRATREKLNLSSGVFAHQLRVSPRTLEKWEQGRARPNDQAATLILLVRKYPDTLKKLDKLLPVI